MKPKDLQRRVDELFAAVVERPESERQQYLDAACANDPAEIRIEVDKLLAMDQYVQADSNFLGRPPLKEVASKMNRAPADKEDDEPKDDARSKQRPSDRNLLLGIVALQLDLVTRDQLISAMHAWMLAKHRPLGEILVEQHSLQKSDREMLEAMVDRHVQLHDNDPEKSLAVLSSIGSVREDLQSLADPDIEKSLANVSAERNDGLERTVTWHGPVEESTSTGERFQIIRFHKGGGLGEVYVARDTELGREVALKRIQEWHADRPDSRARFMLEAEITGGLEHPGIVPVYGLGHDGKGRPFYAMRFIKGNSLREAVKRFHSDEGKRQSESERAVEFRKLLGRLVDVCDAMEYAHSRGVLHRDLKPGNIMLGKYGETLLVDWGLAKVVGRSEQHNQTDEVTLRPSSGSGSAPTRLGQAVGTPAYMSPEQADGKHDELGPATDVYGLGATLYTVLTGKPPLEDATDSVRENKRGKVRRPRELDTAIDRPLEAICLKAIAIVPGDRYTSPRALADDIENWLADTPVSAWPEPLHSRCARWLRKHQTMATSILTMVAVSTVAFAASSFTLNEKRKMLQSMNNKLENRTTELDFANRSLSAALRRAEKDNYASDIRLVQAELNNGNANIAKRLLESSQWDLRGWEYQILEARIRQLERNGDPAAVTTIPPTRVFAHNSAVVATSSDSNGQYLASVCRDGTLNIWSLSTGQRIMEPIRASDFQLFAVAMSPDGTIVATGGEDPFLRLWDRATGKLIEKVECKCGEWIDDIAFSPDGGKLAAVTDMELRIWSLGGAPVRLADQFQKDGFYLGVEFSPDGRRFATSCSEGDIMVVAGASANPVEIFTLDNLQFPTVLNGHLEKATCVAFSHDGRLLASGGHDGIVYIWDAQSGRSLRSFATRRVSSEICFSSDDLRLFVSSWASDGIRVYDATTGNELVALTTGSAGRCNHVAVVGKHALSADEDGVVRLWAAHDESGPEKLVGHLRKVSQIISDPIKNVCVTSGDDRSVRVWNLVTGKEVFRVDCGRRSPPICLSPDGNRLCIGDEHLDIYDLSNGSKLMTLAGLASRQLHGARGRRGEWLLFDSDDSAYIRLWQPDLSVTSKKLHVGIAGQLLAASFDSTWIATLSNDQKVRIWRTELSDSAVDLVGEHSLSELVERIAVSGAGDLLAIAERNTPGLGSVVRLIDTRNLTEVKAWRLPWTNMSALAFSSNGDYVVAAEGKLESEREVRLFSTKTLEALNERKVSCPSNPSSIHFDEMRRLFIAGDEDGGHVLVFDQIVSD